MSTLLVRKLPRTTEIVALFKAESAPNVRSQDLALQLPLIVLQEVMRDNVSFLQATSDLEEPHA
jgi:hypothetical protein